MKRFFQIIFILILTFSYNLKVCALEEETLIILDSSLSMREKLQDTEKYLLAIDEAKKVLSQLPKSKAVGLRTIGIPLDSNAFNYIFNPKEMCKATQLLVPIRPGTANYIQNELDSLFPLGTTPLTYALETAISVDFQKSTIKKHIILITDGGESCDGNPCNFIQNLMRNRKDIRIDIIAINVNGEDFYQLKCLSDTTFGSIVNITTPSEFRNALNNSFKNTYSGNFKLNTNVQQEKRDIIYKNYMFETSK